MDLGLKDRVAIVTGGNRGIGYAISAELLKEGANVVVASLDPGRNAHAIEKLKAGAKGKVIGVPTDLTDPAAIENLFKKTLAEFGRLDILVNNATNVVQGSFFAMDEAAWDRAFEPPCRRLRRCGRRARDARCLPRRSARCRCPRHWREAVSLPRAPTPGPPADRPGLDRR